MKKQYLIIVIAVLVVVLGSSIAVGFVYVKSLSPLCGNVVRSKVLSDDGDYVAYVFRRECGATVRDSSQISVLPSKEVFDATLRGNVFISDEDPMLQVKWTGFRSLGVLMSSNTTVSKKETVFRDVDILYAKSGATTSEQESSSHAGIIGQTGVRSVASTSTPNTEISPQKPYVSTSTKQLPQSACVVGGCSNQLCVDAANEPVVSTCEYTESYACYKTTVCERQTNGHCGWTETPELKQCLLLKSNPLTPQVQ